MSLKKKVGLNNWSFLSSLHPNVGNKILCTEYFILQVCRDCVLLCVLVLRLWVFTPVFLPEDPGDPACHQWWTEHLLSAGLLDNRGTPQPDPRLVHWPGQCSQSGAGRLQGNSSLTYDIHVNVHVNLQWWKSGRFWTIKN